MPLEIKEKLAGAFELNHLFMRNRQPEKFIFHMIEFQRLENISCHGFARIALVIKEN